jgi:hypothetical protein
MLLNLKRLPLQKVTSILYQNVREIIYGANPKIVSYHASVVKIYNAANSVARF